jgi:hypothetical protein
MLNTKDQSKTQLYELDYRDSSATFYKPKSEWDERPKTRFRVTDDSLKNVGIKKGKVLKCSEDFDPIKDEGCLFIVSLSGGSMVARFVELCGSDGFLLTVANEQIPDVIAVAEYTDIIGLVVPRMEKPIPEYESDFDFEMMNFGWLNY